MRVAACCHNRSIEHLFLAITVLIGLYPLSSTVTISPCDSIQLLPFGTRQSILVSVLLWETADRTARRSEPERLRFRSPNQTITEGTDRRKLSYHI